MKEVPLEQLVKERRHAYVADALGCSPSSITRAIQDGRDVRVRMLRGGIHDAYEIRPFPHNQKHTETA